MKRLSAAARTLWIPGVDQSLPALPFDLEDPWERLREAAELPNPGLLRSTATPGGRDHFVHPLAGYTALCGASVGSAGIGKGFCQSCLAFVSLHRPDQRRTVPPVVVACRSGWTR